MDNNKRPMNQTPLEPRVAKLETGLEMLTKDVASLAQIVRDQGTGIETQIRDLAVSVTQAAAPRRTDWQTLIALVMLIMAIGSAVFWPLNQTAQNNKQEIQQLTTLIREHTQLELHPVGKALLGRLEEQLKAHVEDNNRQMAIHRSTDEKEFKDLDEKLQREFALADKTIDQKISGMERVMALIDKEHTSRINKLESTADSANKTDLEELRAWRNKAMGLSAPEMGVPLVPRQVNAPVSK
jgi:predicted house-cleaning noncanonical NTP pyrophosphatase (MazG superfamily)